MMPTYQYNCIRSLSMTIININIIIYMYSHLQLIIDSHVFNIHVCILIFNIFSMISTLSTSLFARRCTYTYCTYCRTQWSALGSGTHPIVGQEIRLRPQTVRTDSRQSDSRCTSGARRQPKC